MRWARSCRNWMIKLTVGLRASMKGKWTRLIFYERWQQVGFIPPTKMDSCDVANSDRWMICCAFLKFINNATLRRSRMKENIRNEIKQCTACFGAIWYVYEIWSYHHCCFCQKSSKLGTRITLDQSNNTASSKRRIVEFKWLNNSTSWK